MRRGAAPSGAKVAERVPPEEKHFDFLRIQERELEKLRVREERAAPAAAREEAKRAARAPTKPEDPPHGLAQPLQSINFKQMTTPKKLIDCSGFIRIVCVKKICVRPPHAISISLD